MTTINYSQSIESILGLTQQINALADENDWLSMQALVERRMRSLDEVFELLNNDRNTRLNSSDRDKLAQIADSNLRILAHAKCRREEIVSAASTLRTGSVAQQAYSATNQL